jgi:hypothetical protein
MIHIVEGIKGVERLEMIAYDEDVIVITVV